MVGWLRVPCGLGRRVPGVNRHPTKRSNMSGERISTYVVSNGNGDATIAESAKDFPSRIVGCIYWTGLRYAVEVLSTAYGNPENTKIIGAADTFDQAVGIVAREYGPVEVRS
jgi:hypothetical protein